MDAESHADGSVPTQSRAKSNIALTPLEVATAMSYYVYLILCEDGSFYTGYTKNLDSRVRLHTSGKGARYTKMHKPKRLVYSESFGSRAEAMKRERRIKKLSHRQKLQLARSQRRRKKSSGRTT